MEFFKFTDRRGVTCSFPKIPGYLPGHVLSTRDWYEVDLLEHLRVTVPRGGVWVDVGANIGNHSLYFGKHCTAKLVCIEPHPANADVLEASLARNAIPATIHRMAVGSCGGTVRLGLPSDDANAGEYTTVAPAHQTIEVEMSTLDILLEGTADVRLLKIDVEGAECEVLDGAKATIARCKPHVVVECSRDGALKAVQSRLPRHKLLGHWCNTPTYHFAPWGAVRFLAYRARRKWHHLFG